VSPATDISSILGDDILSKGIFAGYMVKDMVRLAKGVVSDFGSEEANPITSTLVLSWTSSVAVGRRWRSLVLTIRTSRRTPGLNRRSNGSNCLVGDFSVTRMRRFIRNVEQLIVGVGWGLSVSRVR
jgi:hypothetical protein